jgi:hypothetical protein
MENMQSDDITRSFAAINAGRAAAADRLVTPAWYHPVLGVLAGGYATAITLGDTVVMMVAIVVFLIGLPTLVGVYKRQTGVWIWGFSAGRASRWSVLMGVLLLAAFLGMTYLYEVVGLSWPVWVIGALIVPMVIVVGHRFDEAVRNQLRRTLNSPTDLQERL